MTTRAWRTQLPDHDAEGGSTDDDDDDYSGADYPDAYEIAWKLREANARLLADRTPVNTNRPRRVQFSDPIRDVVCFTPDEDSGWSHAEDEHEEDRGCTESLPCAGTSRLVTAAAVERRGSLTAPVVSGISLSDTPAQDWQPEDNSDEDVVEQESFESDDTSLSENIMELSDDTDKNHSEAVTEDAGVTDVGNDDDGSHSSGRSNSSVRGVDTSRSTPEDGCELDVTAQRPIESTDKSCSEGKASTSTGSDGAEDEETQQVLKQAPADEPAGAAPSSTTAPVAPPDSEPSSEPCNQRPAAAHVMKTARTPTGGSHASSRRSSALEAVYGGKPAAKQQTGTVPVRHGRTRSGRPGSVPKERRQTGLPNSPKRAAHSARRSDGLSYSASTKPPWKPNRVMRELPLPVGAKTLSGVHSTYALPKELKEELVRRQLHDRELRQEREAREADERRQRLLEADRAFRAWVAAKIRQERGSRINVSTADTLTEREPSSGRAEQRHRQEAFEGWLRRKRRQQREEELRRRLRDMELGATDRPRHSRHEAQLVYRAWLQRKWEEEREQRLAVRAEQRGTREAALSSHSLRLLQRYLGSDEFARYPELVL